MDDNKTWSELPPHRYLFHYSHIDATDSAFEQVLEQYARWVIKAGKRKGVPRSLTVEKLKTAATVDEIHPRCRIKMRRVPGAWLLYFAHQDVTTPERWWVTQVRLQARLDKKMTLEHAAWQLHTEEAGPSFAANTPNVLKSLLSSKQNLLAEKHAYHQPITLREGDVNAFIRHQFFAPDRTWPLVVISSYRKKAGSYRLDPKEVFKALRSQVIVVVLPNIEATMMWSNALRAHTHDKYANCFDGAIGLYMPVTKDAYSVGASAWNKTSRLWLASRIYGGERALNYITSAISRYITLKQFPVNLLDATERFDLAQRAIDARNAIHAMSQVRANQINPQAALKLEEEHEAQIKAYDNLQAEYDRVVKQLAESRALVEYADEEIEGLEADKEELENQVSALKSELHDIRTKAAALDYQVQAKAESTDTLLNQEEGAQLRHFLSKKRLPSSMKLEDALRLLGALWNERVVILESAYDSAKESHDFNKVPKAFDMMCMLLEDYLDAMNEGQGVTQAKNCFASGNFAAHESETVRTNARAKTLRTFMYKGHPTEFWEHLKIGTKPSTREGWRLHFIYDPDASCIVIGWCGKHLDHR